MKFVQQDMFGHVEDVETAPPVAVADNDFLTDEDLRRSGVVPVRAYMRTRASKAAARSRRSRERAAAGETGPARKQISIQAPADDAARAALKAAAAAMLAGDVSAETVAQAAQGPDPMADLGRRAAELMERRGVRAWLLRRWLRRS